MIRKNFNGNWKFAKGTASMMSAFLGGGREENVHLPHDAMIHETCTEKTKNGAQTGFFPGGEYIYRKLFYAPSEWEDKTVVIEFEGIYQTAMIYVNGNYVTKNLSGYSNFYVKLDGYLHYGEENEIKVMVDNSAEPNSRWYSGSGIYRDVNIFIGGEIHIPTDGLRIKTIEASSESAIVEIEVTVKSLSKKQEKVQIETYFLYKGENIKSDRQVMTIFPGESEISRASLCIEKPHLWSCDTPDLYQCKVVIKKGNEILDKAETVCGIRTVTVDSEHGLRINGIEVKLRGTCIHHDNGIIGATTLRNAEERKCRLLKEAGFNSIRSAHHPAGKALLDACDKYGILVMDELSDMWTFHKNPHDFALNFTDCWEQETIRMVNKDYNHPSVILYSVGNEIAEVGTSIGRKINRMICNKLHALDNTRFTINGLNGIMAISFSSRLEEIMKDVMKEHAVEMQKFISSSKELEGSNELNQFLSFMNGTGADIFACHPVLTETLEECSLSSDIIGLNYLTGRHVMEKQLHPNKTVIGTETYPAEIVRLWKIVKENKHVLGDFTWTGYDYLGEAGCGIFHYDGKVNFSSIYPERAAYIGDIDLVGYRRPISYLREIVYGLRKDPYIAVERVNRYGMKHSKTAWMYKDNIASWTWPGYEGKPAVVDVYADADEVELFLNGTSMGRKPAGEKNDYTATYELLYQSGKLEAVSYIDNQEIGRFNLNTATDTIKISATADRDTIFADGEELSFITVKLIDENGVENLNLSKEITVSVSGNGTLQGVGSAIPATEKSYDCTSWETYDGYLLVVVRAGEDEGEITVSLSAEQCESCEIKINVVKGA